MLLPVPPFPLEFICERAAVTAAVIAAWTMAGSYVGGGGGGGAVPGLGLRFGRGGIALPKENERL